MAIPPRTDANSSTNARLSAIRRDAFAADFAFEDITGVPWIEIDFAADIERANAEILPRIMTAEGKRQAPIILKGVIDRAETREL